MRINLLLFLSLTLFSSDFSTAKLPIEKSVGARNTQTRPAENRSYYLTENKSSAQSNLTGTYEYIGFGRNNEFQVRELGAGEIKVAFYGTGEFESQAGKMVNTGEIAATEIKIEGNRAVLVPEDAPQCRLTLTFKGNQLEIEQNENDCGFPGAVYAGGTYRKISDKMPPLNLNSSNVQPPVNLESQGGSRQDNTAKRIRFPKGASGATVNGKIVGGKTVSYLVRVKAGQTISVKIIQAGAADDLSFEVIAPDGNRLGGNDRMNDEWSQKLGKTGDYVLWVSTLKTQYTNFKLQVSIR